MRAVDTNILVRLVTRDDVHQVAAAEAFVESGAWVSILCLAEAIWVLARVYGHSARELADVIAMLRKHDRLVLEEPDIVAAALKLFRERPGLGFSDCLILELARKAGYLPLGTFDRALAKADGAQRI